MSAAKVDIDGAMTCLDGKAEPDEVVTEADVQDASKLARGLSSMAKLLARLRRRFVPRRIDFEDITLGVSGALVQLEHGFGGRVRWWVVDNQISGSDPYMLQRDEDLTTANTLVLNSYEVAVVTIRVEEAG